MDEKSLSAIELLKNRQNNSLESVIAASKYIKNIIIGNSKKKKQFLEQGLLPIFVDILQKDKDETLLIQAASVIGSFACRLDEGSKKVFESNAVPALVTLLSHRNPKLVESAARSLKILLLYYNHPTTFIYEDDGIKLLVTLCKHPLESINEISVTILARACESLIRNPGKFDMTITQYQAKVHRFGGLDSIISILLSSKSKVQEACLYAIELFTRDNKELSSYLITRSPDNIELRTIIQLTKDNSPRTQLLAATCICNLYQTKVLPDSYDSSSSEKLQENALSAIAVLCSMRDDSRRQVADLKLIPNIVSFLQSNNQAIRAAACRCARSLSRSIKHLRTSLYDSSISLSVLKLLDDPSLDVRISATATMCNLVLDFSPMKQTAIDNGVVKKLVEFTDEKVEYLLRLNSIWALKNLLYLADTPIKVTVLKELTYERLLTLLKDPKTPIVEQALSILRNLAYKDNSDLTTCEASNQEKHRNTIMSSMIIIPKIGDYFNHRNNEIRNIAIWCITNLLENDNGTQARLLKLKELGFYEKIVTALANDQNEEVKSRAKEAIIRFN
ncbi:armadillo repeat-containing protein [Heterostelium album PN500]|uniref:Armadillo repeat-containing protein n=1 Tax=Heterostelium pallidum (strain ATCC 26659 / Pp 5 / PN500) TaxID=670386 RepID=D3BGC3_HETP5|nr:armadillo repeat-containing protein [Heterostelium album PN500]EFA79523.1 armadillo repeat-containing protein [Heterostelium album PN500]|eukprot:XP_020431644.1 armadillo repeat-containing protein [Heterostelium album PN500]